MLKHHDKSVHNSCAKRWMCPATCVYDQFRNFFWWSLQFLPSFVHTLKKCAPNTLITLFVCVCVCLLFSSRKFHSKVFIITNKKSERCLLDTHKWREKYLSSVHDMMPEIIMLKLAKGEGNQIKEPTHNKHHSIISGCTICTRCNLHRTMNREQYSGKVADKQNECECTPQLNITCGSDSPTRCNRIEKYAAKKFDPFIERAVNWTIFCTFQRSVQFRLHPNFRRVCTIFFLNFDRISREICLLRKEIAYTYRRWIIA